MVNYLYPPGASTPNLQGTSTGGMGGNRFYTASSGISVYALGWYRGDTTSPAPSSLRLRNQATNTELAAISPAPDSGVVGWQYQDLGSPVSIPANTMFEVIGVEPSGFHVYRLNAGHVTPDAPWSWETAIYGPSYYNVEGSLSNEAGYSVTDASVGSPSAPASGAIYVQAPLGDWLSTNSGVNLHQSDGTPWLTWQNVSTLLSRMGNVTSGEVTSYGLSDATLVAAVLKALDYLVTNGNNIDGLTSAIGRIFDWLGGDPKPADQDALATILNRLDLASGGAEHYAKLLQGQPVFPATGWQMDDETDFVGALSWDVPADLYTLSISDSDGIAARDVAGATWYPRVGWWAVRNGDLLSDRRFFEFANNYLSDGGRRMPGLLVKGKGLVVGHVEAWTFPYLG